MLDAGERFFMFDAPKAKKPTSRKFMSLQDHVPKSPPTVPALSLRELQPKNFRSALSEQYAAVMRSQQHLSHHLHNRYTFEPIEDKGELFTQESDFFFQRGSWRLNEDQ